MSRQYWKIVSSITIWHVAASICFYMVSAGTPFFRDVFELSGFEVGVIITVLMLGYAIFLLPLGVVTDWFGERLLLTVGLLGLGTGTVLITVAPVYGFLLLAVFFLGTMYGTATPGTNKAIFDNIEPGRQHRAMGIKQVGPTVGSAIGAVLVTSLAGVFFWQLGFLVGAAIAAAVAIGFYTCYTSVSTASSTLPSFGALIADRSYLLLLSAGVCIGAGVYTTVGYTVLYVEESIGSAVAVGGLVLASIQVFGSVGRVTLGWLADVLPGAPRVGIGLLLAAQPFVAAALFFGIPLANTPVSAAIVLSAIGFFGLGSTGLYFSYVSTIVSDSTLGSASAGAQLAAVVGGLFSPPTFGYLVDTIGYDAGWLFLGALSFTAAVLVTLVVITAR